MKKLISLIKATMTSDMRIFKINTTGKKSNINKILIAVLIIYIMAALYAYATFFLEKLSPMHIEYLLLSASVFLISLFTIVEGIYKCGPLLFNCKDDQLLLSLPIKRKTVLFIRLFKFYLFELLFNTLFTFPIILAYIIKVGNIPFNFYITSLIMLLLLPIIPVTISCVLGFVSSFVTSKFKHKNIVEIIISFIFMLGMIYVYYKGDKIIDYVMKNATSFNDMITKIYYPAGMYAKFATDFKIMDLLIFIIINIVVLLVTVYVLSLFYFKINSNLKEITKTKLTTKELKIKTSSKNMSLIKKELNTFFNIPIFIVNAGFGLVIYVVMCTAIIVKFDGMIELLNNTKILLITTEMINKNISLLVLLLITITAYTTTITSSLISLEGKNINILKSLPVDPKEIFKSKILACVLITTPVLVLGCIALLVKFKISIIDSILLLALTILMPLVSHFIGLIVNLKHPRLDYESAAEVVKQSASMFISMMIGAGLLLAHIGIILAIFNKINVTLFLLIVLMFYIALNYALYTYLNKVGEKYFKKLQI